MNSRLYARTTRERGRHLLGVQSEMSKLLEEMATIVRSSGECDWQGAACHRGRAALPREARQNGQQERLFVDFAAGRKHHCEPKHESVVMNSKAA